MQRSITITFEDNTVPGEEPYVVHDMVSAISTIMAYAVDNVEVVVSEVLE